MAAALAGPAGTAGLLIPPDDAGAAVAALERLRDDDALRAGLIDAALALARAGTMERAHDRVEAFLAAHARPAVPQA